MPRPTLPLHNRIVVFFDFDETLAPKTDRVLLDHLGLDPDEFARTRIQPLKDRGFENILAKAWALIQLSNSDPRYRISRALLAEIGRGYPLYPGVDTLFRRLREVARAIVADVEVEFHLVTAGFREIPAATPLAPEFAGIWGGEFEFDDQDNIAFVKSIISHPEKVRYVMMIAKGLDETGANGPEDIWKPIADQDWHVPLDQVVFVGDGNSDKQAFGFLYRTKGIGIGVKGREDREWSATNAMHDGRAVENVAPASYENGSELCMSLELAIQSICHRIKLRSLAQH